MTSLKQFETIVTLWLHMYDNFMVFKAPEASTKKATSIGADGFVYNQNGPRNDF